MFALIQEKEREKKKHLKGPPVAAKTPTLMTDPLNMGTLQENVAAKLQGLVARFLQMARAVR